MLDDSSAFDIMKEDHLQIISMCNVIETMLLKNDCQSFVQFLFSEEERLLLLISEHFGLEENVVFPAIIDAHNDREITDSVLLMMREHGEISFGVQMLFGIINGNEILTTELEKGLLDIASHLIALVYKHESDENSLYERVGMA